MHIAAVFQYPILGIEMSIILFDVLWWINNVTINSIVIGNNLRWWWNDTRVPEPIMDDVRCTKDDDISTCYKRIMGHNCKQDDKVWLRCYNETGLMWEFVIYIETLKNT